MPAIHTRKKALALCIGYCLANSVYAQNPAAENSKDKALEEVEVIGVRASQAKAIDIKRDSKQIVDSIVAEDIGKLPDVTIADSLQRVTGIQINREAGEGTSLNIRGMPQVLTTLNGEQFLSPWSITGIQANYSDIPASLMAGVDVYKSQSASSLVGGISGIVDLKTLDPSSLEEGFTARVRGELGAGSRSTKEYKKNGDVDQRDPDTNLAVILGYNSGEKFSGVASIYAANSYAANYSMWQELRLAYLDSAGGRPQGVLSDPYAKQAYPNDWYIVPRFYSASSGFVERDRLGSSISLNYEINENWTAKADVFYTTMDKFNRGVRADFNGFHTPDSYSQNNQPAKQREEILDVLQKTSLVGAGQSFSYWDVEGSMGSSGIFVPSRDAQGNTIPVQKTVTLHPVHVADIWAADFQTTSTNEIEKTAAINTNIQLDYTNNDNLNLSFRLINADAEKQKRYAQFQQGTPAWLWVDIDGNAGKDPLPGYKVSVDYRGKYPKFSYQDDLSNAKLLEQYQGFADGVNTDATLNVLRSDLSLELNGSHLTSIDAGLRYGLRSASNNKFFYVTPTGRYTDWEDPRVPVDKRYKLLPGNLVWQKFPNWLRFDYAKTNPSLRTIGGLEDNGFTAAETMKFNDFGPIQGFENGVASLNPANWDNPYEFMNRLYPGTRTVNDPGFTYQVDESTTSGYMQFNFEHDAGFFGMHYTANVGLQAVDTKRNVYKSNAPSVLDSFNSIGYDDWQKIVYVYTTNKYTASQTEFLPSFNINVWPTEDLVVRLGAARTMTRNDLEEVGSGLSVWVMQCVKTNEQGEPVKVPDPSNPANQRDETVGCVGGGDDKGRPDIKPWMASVFNASSEWYFGDDAILGLGAFLIQVDTSVERFQELRSFADMDGIDRGRKASIYTTQNADAADLYGIELGYRQPFSFIDVPVLRSMGIEANYTYSHSETEEKDLFGNTLPLPSNSENQSNFILWYDQSGINVRLAYNYRSKEFVDRAGINTNVTTMSLGNWVKPVGYLDLSMSYYLNDHLNFFMNATNLTEEDRYSYAQFEDQMKSLWVQETRYSIGVNYSW
jgi:iron complex outermembrane recepter protein